MKHHVSLNNNSFDHAGLPKDCQDAVCEYIHNGFEAGASRVCVSLRGADMQEACSLTVADNGSGISYNGFSTTFGTFLSSTKNASSLRIRSQANKGKGRFSYLCFAPSARWDTVYEDKTQLKQYTISTSSAQRSSFETTKPEPAPEGAVTGTAVTFPLMDSDVTNKLSFVEMKPKLLEEFAWFLYLHRGQNFSLEYMGTVLDVSEYINTDLSRTCTKTIEDFPFEINTIVWRSNVSNNSKIYYMTPAGELLEAKPTSYNKNQAGFYHAVFVHSPFFRPGMNFSPDPDNPTLFDLAGQEEQQKVLCALRAAIRAEIDAVFRQFLVLQADKTLDDMEKRGTFPQFRDDAYDQLRKKDFMTVTRELYCVEPRIFHKLSTKQEASLLGFLNLLLSSDERENVLTIVEQIVQLTPAQRKSFADVLQRSRLQYIVDSIEILQRRAAVVEELKRIVFDAAAFANERDHVQKLIEQHFWLFGEQYHLLTADKNLATSLREFEAITQTDGAASGLSMTEAQARQRIDIFLYTQRIQEDDSSEMLIIELKAPHVHLSLDVFNQIVRYANTLRREPRFASLRRVWRFIAVCTEVDDDVKVKYANFKQYGKKGLADIIGNFELYALTWDDVFQMFEARNSFLLNKLHLDYSQLSQELALPQKAPESRAETNEAVQQLCAVDAF